MIDNESNKNQIKETLNNPTKLRIIRRIKANGRSNFGRLIKDLSLSTRAGVAHVVELKNIVVVNYVKNSTLLELNYQKLESSGFES